MNWSKIKIHYIASIHLFWMIVPFVCLHSTNTTKTANGNNNNKQIRPIHSQTKIQYRKIKSCQFGWLLLRLPFRRHWAYVRSVGLSSKHAEQIIHTNKRIESPPFPFRLFMLFFFHSDFFPSPFRILGRRHWYHSWILGIITSIFSVVLANVWYIFLVSCTLINTQIQLFILCIQVALFSSVFFPLNTWLLCVYALKRSSGNRSRHHIF